MIISFNGAEGSGKSTIAKMLAEKLSWPRYYIGGLRREKAAARGMTLAEYNKLGETDPSTDFEVDTYQKELGEKEDDFIIEGRTSWYFIPHSFKIYLDVSIDEGARRVFAAIKNGERKNKEDVVNNEKDVLKSLQKRRKSDDLRYKKYFNIDVYNKNNFDFVLNTTGLSAQDVFDKVYKEVQKRLKTTNY